MVTPPLIVPPYKQALRARPRRRRPPRRTALVPISPIIKWARSLIPAALHRILRRHARITQRPTLRRGQMKCPHLSPHRRTIGLDLMSKPDLTISLRLTPIFQIFQRRRGTMRSRRSIPMTIPSMGRPLRTRLSRP